MARIILTSAGERLDVINNQKQQPSNLTQNISAPNLLKKNSIKAKRQWRSNIKIA